jgi:hypothetical protein
MARLFCNKFSYVINPLYMYKLSIIRVGTIVPILDENVIVNSFLNFPDYRPIHFEMVIDR